MLESYYNGCKDPKTMKVYSSLYNIHHVHTFSMKVNDDGYEEVNFTFDHYKDTFHARILPTESDYAELWIELDTITPEGDKEFSEEFYGVVELAKLVELLNKLPHIGSIVEGFDLSLH